LESTSIKGLSFLNQFIRSHHLINCFFNHGIVGVLILFSKSLLDVLPCRFFVCEGRVLAYLFNSVRNSFWFWSWGTLRSSHVDI